MRLEKCPHCDYPMRFSMDYCNSNPVIVYTCDNCLYTTFGEAYTTDNKTTITTSTGFSTTSTATKYTVAKETNTKYNSTIYYKR